MSLQLEGRRAVITGGTSGIGFAVAEALLGEGGDVGVVGRDPERVQHAVQSLRGRFPGRTVIGASGDVGDEDSIVAAVEAVSAGLGGLDIVVNSAGIAGEYGAEPGAVPAAEFLEVQRINVLGSYLVVKAALPHLERARDAAVVLVGSDSGFVAAPGMLAYNASKGAIVQLTRALSVELAERVGIRVNSVCPSIVDTPMSRDGMGVASFADADYPVSDPSDIAWVILTLLSPRSRAVNGVSLLADFGYHARSVFPA